MDKWCPHTRVTELVYDWTCSPQIPVSSNSANKITSNEPIPGSYCIGPRCQMWKAGKFRVGGDCGLKQ